MPAGRFLGSLVGPAAPSPPRACRVAGARGRQKCLQEEETLVRASWSKAKKKKKKKKRKHPGLRWQLFRAFARAG